MLPNITKKQKEILFHILRFRTITAKHTQILLHHKNHRKIYIWLTDLTNKKYIGEIKAKKSPRDNRPDVYYLERNGLLFLKDQPTIEKSYLEKMRYESKKKQPFIEKCLFIINTYLYLSKQAANDDYILKFYTQNDFSKKAKIRDLMPSFAYVKEHSGGKQEEYAGEFIAEKMPERALQGRIDSYLTYFSDAKRTSPMHILFICQNGRKFNQAKRYLKETMDEYVKNIDFQILAYDEVRDGNIERNRK